MHAGEEVLTASPIQVPEGCEIWLPRARVLFVRVSFSDRGRPGEYRCSPVVRSVAASLLANDVDQALRLIEVASHSQPAGGSVTVEPDGSFIFIAEPGFTGTTSFTYRARTNIFDDPTAVFVTEPTTVVLRVRCLGDVNFDGQADLADYSTVASCFSVPGLPPAPGCEITDADLDGDTDLADFARFQTKFGCQ